MSQVSVYLNQILEGLWGTALTLQLCNVKFVPVLIENIFVLHSFLPVKTPRHFLQAEGAVIQGDSDGSQRWCGELTSRLETNRSLNQLSVLKTLEYNVPVFLIPYFYSTGEQTGPGLHKL